ncbi:ret finger protein-like 4A [Erpetoichthys calabaricus]|uniref:Ret finger protein-like 4A n=1 Tax=Erpetoichthys calabaricus TaxID=27687 RepID=A0A8C4T8F8_ERPCA|nr:ret finger protein-like 4A [Erpetoichthys calabaricus]
MDIWKIIAICFILISVILFIILVEYCCGRCRKNKKEEGMWRPISSEVLEIRDSEESGFIPNRVWKNIQKDEVDMVLLPDTAHHELSLDEDASQIRFKGNTQGPDRWYCVTGSDWLMKGRHYWEVEVGEKSSWALGLATEEIKMSKVIPESPGNGFWIIRLCGGKQFEAVSSTVTELQEKPKKVGVYQKSDELSFYNAESKTVIHKFSIEYHGLLYPVFSPGSRDKGPLIIKKKETGFMFALNSKAIHPNSICELEGQYPTEAGILPCVIGKDKLTSGKFNWEVDVCEKSSWALGVVSHTHSKKTSIPENPEDGYWIIKMSGGKFQAVSNTSINLLRKPNQVLVFLNFKDAELSFYDTEKKHLIYRFQLRSSLKLYPIFSPPDLRSRTK